MMANTRKLIWIAALLIAVSALALAFSGIHIGIHVHDPSTGKTQSYTVVEKN